MAKTTTTTMKRKAHGRPRRPATGRAAPARRSYRRNPRLGKGKGIDIMSILKLTAGFLGTNLLTNTIGNSLNLGQFKPAIPLGIAFGIKYFLGDEDLYKGAIVSATQKILQAFMPAQFAENLAGVDGLGEYVDIGQDEDDMAYSYQEPVPIDGIGQYDQYGQQLQAPGVRVPQPNPVMPSVVYLPDGTPIELTGITSDVPEGFPVNGMNGVNDYVPVETTPMDGIGAVDEGGNF